MEFKNILETIKVMLSEAVKPKVETVEMREAKLADGTLISYDDKICNIINTDGTLTPCTAGEIVLEDGTKIVIVDDNGTIGEVTQPDNAQGHINAEEEELVCKKKKLSDEEVMALVDSMEIDMAEYPWETCIKDQEEAGYDEETANKICGAIKAKNAPEEMEVNLEDSPCNQMAKLNEKLNQVLEMFEKVVEQFEAKEKANEERFSAIENTPATKPIHESEKENTIEEKPSLASKIAAYKKVKTQ